MRNKAIILVATLALILCGCAKESDRSAYPRDEFVMIYYCAGFNDLSSDIQGNLDVLKSANIPFAGSKHKLITYTHFSVSDSDFKTLMPSHIVDVYRKSGKVVSDTLYTIDKTRYATDPDVMREVLQRIADLYPNAHYGLVVSSHGTGWLPAGKYNGNDNVILFSRRRSSDSAGMPLFRYNENPDEPKVKTFGAEVEVRDSQKYSREMSIQSMAAAIPIHLDYLLFDACLMGCIEVAYEFKDVADKVAFSPTEVLADGFDYSDISTLLSNNISIEGFCERYFNHYLNSSATISVVKTDGLAELATISGQLFSKYRTSINGLGIGSGIQKYFRSGHHWFYDLKDILVKAGITAGEASAFDAALDKCITYKAATKAFLGLEIVNYSGLGMYLPSAGDADLDEFYKTLSWNKATNLVEE